MYTPQAGIFALGTSSHSYLEFDILDAKKGREFASTISAIREPRTTTGGVNFVIGFRPELWRDIVPDDSPPGVEGFNHEIQGTEGFVMPSTQHDALVWLSGSAYDVIFELALPARSRSYRLHRWLRESDAARRPHRGTLARRSSRCCRLNPAASKV